jgi:hypothetical protein
MTDPARDSVHIRDEELLDYYEEKLPDTQQRLIEEHLARCDDCTRTAREVYAFHETWDSWTAAEHGRIHFEELVRGALYQAESLRPEWRARLQRWRRRWGGLGEAVLRVVTEATADAGRVVAEGLDSLSRPGSAWRLNPVTTAAYGIRGETPETDVALFASAALEGEAQAQITVRAAQSGEVKVRVDHLADASGAPLVLLVDTAAGGAPSVLVERVKWKEGADYGLAHFRDVPPGEYLVVIEPLEGKAGG